MEHDFEVEKIEIFIIVIVSNLDLMNVNTYCCSKTEHSLNCSMSDMSSFTVTGCVSCTGHMMNRL